jgi:hypothetical protein
MRALKDIFSEQSDQKERNISFQEFQDKAFAHVPAKGIISLLRENQNSWTKIIVGEGSDYFPYGEYSNEILQESDGNLKNVLFMLISLEKSEIKLFEKLREKADYFEIGSGLQEKLFLALFFLKR